MSQKYNEIIQLVHPLFDSLLSKSYGIKFRTKEELMNHIINNKKELVAISTTLNTYKRAVDVINKKKPNALFVIVLPAAEEKFSGKETVAVYNHLVNNLIDYSKRILKNRVEITDFNPQYVGHKQFINPKTYDKLNKNINLYSFGEYSDACVTSWLNYSSENLFFKKINVVKKIILKNYSLNNITTSPNIKKSYLDKKILKRQKKIIKIKSKIK